MICGNCQEIITPEIRAKGMCSCGNTWWTSNKISSEHKGIEKRVRGTKWTKEN